MPFSDCITNAGVHRISDPTPSISRQVIRYVEIPEKENVGKTGRDESIKRVNNASFTSL